MTISQPPRFAGRLLTRLVPAQDHEVLLGDLNEEFQRGRSLVWYWAQILVAIVVGSWKDIRAHKLIALRATVVGFASVSLTGSASLAIRTGLTHGGWAGLPRYWRYSHPWTYELIFQTLFIASLLFVGWIVVRLHRAHGLTMLFAFKGFWLASMGVMFLWYAILFTFRPGQHGLLAPLANQFYVAIINHFGRQFALMLFGGYLATRRPEIA